VFDIESNGASPTGETAGLVTGKESGKRLVAGLEPSAELLAIAMGASCRPASIFMQHAAHVGMQEIDNPLAAPQCTSCRASWAWPD
jgi:hypothetical protein